MRQHQHPPTQHDLSTQAGEAYKRATAALNAPRTQYVFHQDPGHGWIALTAPRTAVSPKFASGTLTGHIGYGTWNPIKRGMMKRIHFLTPDPGGHIACIGPNSDRIYRNAIASAAFADVTCRNCLTAIKHDAAAEIFYFNRRNPIRKVN